jgi:hypothetical protein
MDLSAVSNIVALILSGLALALSILFTRRQIRLSHGSNLLTLLGSTFRNLRTEEFIQAQDFIYYELPMLDPKDGIGGLPSESRLRVLLVLNFYNDLGRLVVHGALDEEVVLSSFGENLHQTWVLSREFISRERELLPVRFMLYLEDLACRVRERGQRNVGEEFHLREWES